MTGLLSLLYHNRGFNVQRCQQSPSDTWSACKSPKDCHEQLLSLSTCLTRGALHDVMDLPSLYTDAGLVNAFEHVERL